jgi:hypothetical protein
MSTAPTVDDLPSRVAVTCTVVVDRTAAEVTLKLTLVAPAGTVADAGTVTFPLLSDSAIDTPGEGAGRDKVRVQGALPGVTIDGAQLSEYTIREGMTVTDSFDDTPSRVAVISTVLLEVTAAAATLNEIDVFPVSTVT